MLNFFERIKSNKQATVRALKNSLWVILGSLILAVAVGVFIKPFSLVTGGVSGLSIAIAEAVPFSALEESGKEMEIYTAIITWTLFFVGFIFLGKAFAVKTLLSSIVFTVALPIVTTIAESDFLGGMLNIAKGFSRTESGISDYALPLIAAVFGGVLVGVGCAFTFRGGGSTGGLDILALIVVKYVKRAKSSVMVFVFDGLVVLVGIFVIKDLILCLLGVTSAFIVAIVIDKVFIGASKAFIANIISEKHEEMREAILYKLDRACTVITARGGYTDVDRPMIMVTFTMPQYAAFIAIVHSVDRNAFVTVHQAHEIDGEGFSRYDVRRRSD